MRQNGSNFQILALERELRSETWCQWSRKYPSLKFPPILAAHGQKFWFGLFADMRPEPETAFWDATKLVKFPNFFPGERILLQNMMPVVSKVSLLEISPILAAHVRKFWFDLFNWRATRTWDHILRCDKMVKFSNFCPGERILLRNMTPVVSKVSLLEISPILAAPRSKITIGSFWPSCE